MCHNLPQGVKRVIAIFNFHFSNRLNVVVVVVVVVVILVVVVEGVAQ